MLKAKHITKVIVTSVILGITLTPSLAQTLTPRVICSGYGAGQGGGIKLNYTVGETFVTTLRNGNTVLTQGFHQPEINNCDLNLNLSSTDTIEICPGENITAPEGFDSYSWNTGNQTQSISPLVEGWFTCAVALLNCEASDSVYVRFLSPLPYYADSDGDGYGNYELPIQSCYGAPYGYVSDNTDCNDGNALVYLGASCSDENPCTVNDLILADCSCAGTFADADTDGTCDANDNCAGPEAGAACDDNNPCTVGDVILADCSCAGTFADADNDGTCDANDNCAGPEAGAACDDNNPCTVNDVILADCSCAGTFADADNDGTCDANDNCAGPEAGTACDDNNPCTVGDVILADCSCAGTFADSDNDGTCDANDLCVGPEPGSACDDGNACTVSDAIQSDCTCAGTFADNDNDGTCDANDLCAGAEPGTACDDNNPCTINDVITADCSCAGTFADADFDGTCDANDLCFGAEPGSACDDGNVCTANDVITAECQCVGTPVAPDTSSKIIHACGPYTWNNNVYTQSGTYEVTLPNAAGCDSIAQLMLTIGTPTFSNESVNACDSYAWNGTTYTQSGTYTYVTTNNTGCPNTATLNLTVNPTLTPSFNAVNPYCSGASIPALPTTSTNGIQGAWSPAINNTATTTYTFTPSAGQCATTTSLTVTIHPNVTPTFTAVGPYCSGASIPALPTISTNGIQGAWSPALNNTATTAYTFTPNAGQCATTTSLTVTIHPNVTPTFNAVGPYCSGASIPALPTTSANGIQGAWSPALNNTATTTYTFTPSAGQCATTTSLTITINTNSTAPSSATASSTNVAANTTVTLTVNGGSLGTGAQWKWYSSSCGGTSVGTGASIAVNVGTTTTYFVRAEGTCNTTSCASVTVNVQSTACGPVNVSATATTICAGSSTTLSVQGNTGTGGAWKWYKSGCGSGTCAYTGSTYTVSPTTTTTYFVRAEGGSCGTTACMSITITVNPLPAKPGSISGPVSGLCGMQNVTYTTSACAGATSYQWTVPAGVTIVSGQGTASLVVNYSNTIGNNSSCGNTSICVRSGNSCGWSAYQCQSLQLLPQAPASISGSSTPCRNQPVVYSVASVAGATSYLWTVPSGYTIQSGQGTNTVTILPGNTNGSISVKAINACGSSVSASKSLRPKSCTTSMPMLDLWPNPTSERVFFSYDENMPELFEIYDMMGRTIYTGRWISEYDVTGLAGGIYFVRATYGGESVVKRMEVVR